MGYTTIDNDTEDTVCGMEFTFPEGGTYGYTVGKMDGSAEIFGSVSTTSVVFVTDGTDIVVVEGVAYFETEQGQLESMFEDGDFYSSEE